MTTHLIVVDGHLGDTPSGAAHMSAERLAAYLDERLTPTERDAAVSHLADCAACRREMAAVRKVLVRTPVWTRRRLVAPLLTALAAVLVFMLVPRFFQGRFDTSATERATSQAPGPDATPVIAVIAPADGDTVTASGLRFTWRAAGPDATYRLVLQDATGGVRWTASTTDTTATLPAGITLAAGAAYFWSLDALRADGRSMKTGVQRISIR